MTVYNISLQSLITTRQASLARSVINVNKKLLFINITAYFVKSYIIYRLKPDFSLIYLKKHLTKYPKCSIVNMGVKRRFAKKMPPTKNGDCSAGLLGSINLLV